MPEIKPALTVSARKTEIDIQPPFLCISVFGIDSGADPLRTKSVPNESRING